MKSLNGYLLIVVVSIGLFAHDAISLAKIVSDDPRYAEVWKKSQDLKDQQSFDTTPLEFNAFGVHYKVPRNYLSIPPGNASLPITFRVTFPRFEPLTEKTKQCLTQPRADWPAGCIPVEFWLEGPPVGTDDQHFNSARKLFHSQVPKQGPAGFEMYETGPENARIETDRKNTSTHTLVIDCIIFSGYQGKRDAVCDSVSPLRNGNTLFLRLSLDQIPYAENIDEGIRTLIDSFTVKGDKP
jgi:hypothetical protein